MVGIWTDGTTYEGEYVSSNGRRKFSVHSARISASDYALNKLIYRFISKYGSNKNYIQLEILIDSDKPSNKY
jgi:hypothetical protein